MYMSSFIFYYFESFAEIGAYMVVTDVLHLVARCGDFLLIPSVYTAGPRTLAQITNPLVRTWQWAPMLLRTNCLNLRAAGFLPYSCATFQSPSVIFFLGIASIVIANEIVHCSVSTPAHLRTRSRRKQTVTEVKQYRIKN